jgi:hypothetical protein
MWQVLPVCWWRQVLQASTDLQHLLQAAQPMFSSSANDTTHPQCRPHWLCTCEWSYESLTLPYFKLEVAAGLSSWLALCNAVSVPAACLVAVNEDDARLGLSAWQPILLLCLMWGCGASLCWQHFSKALAMKLQETEIWPALSGSKPALACT